jgi:hypothetical protein
MRAQGVVRAAGLVTCLVLASPVDAFAKGREKGDEAAIPEPDVPTATQSAPQERGEDPDRGGAAPSSGLAVKPHPTPWLTPNVQLQTWFTAWDQDESKTADVGGYGDPELDTGFTMPRARLGFDGGYKWVDFRLRVGTSTPFDQLDKVQRPFDIVDAWTRLRFDTRAGTTSIVIGQHTVPFSRESQMSTNDIPFQERSVSSTWLSPVRDLGATLRHDTKLFGAAVGLFNGNGSWFGNADNGVAVSARLEAHVGGDTYRTNDTRDAFGVGIAYMYSKTPSDSTQRFGGDLLGRIKGFTVFLEAGANVVDPAGDPTILPPSVPEKTLRWGGQATLTYYKELKIGAIEPAVRFSYYDDAKHLKDNGDVGILHGGLTWREPVPFLDVGAVYIHRFELAGRDIKNDSVRLFFGLRFPSRKYAPPDLVKVFRGLGAKPLARDGATEEANDATVPRRKR